MARATMRIIGGEARGRKLVAPADSSIRPVLDRIRESIFATIESELAGRSVLDLFAGVGSVGLEAVSRGARRAVLVDHGKQSLAILRQNIDNLGFSSRCQVVAGDALAVPGVADLERETYALVFVDPPFKMFNSPKETAQLFRRLTELLEAGALTEGGRLLLRHPSSWGEPPPREPSAVRVYGESTVLYYDSP